MALEQACRKLGAEIVEHIEQLDGLEMLWLRLARCVQDRVVSRGFRHQHRDIAAERYPGLKVLLTSGFPGETLTRIGSEGKGFRLIGKPYRKEELERAIRQVLAT